VAVVSDHPHGAVPKIPADKADDYASAYRSIVRKTWEDPAFKADYLANPEKYLRDAGIPIPEGTKVKVVEHADGEEEGSTVITMPLPSRLPSISDESLAAVAGGGSSSSASSASSASCPCCSAGSSGSAC
jgi:hypothetical protein